MRLPRQRAAEARWNCRERTRDPGEMLPLEERFESYNRERGRSLPVSRGEWAGEVRYRFADQEQGVEVLVGLSPGKGDPFPAEVLFQRRSFDFDMPVLPLAQGGAEGSASLSLADLTGDGVPELVYIWGGGREPAALGGQLPGIRPVYRGGVPHHPGPGADALPGAGGAAGTAGRSSHLSGHRPRRSVGGSSPVVPRV